MIKKKWFTWQEVNENDPSRCIIVPLNYSDFPFNTKNGGSYHVVPARVLGLDYPTYLRFIKQSFPNDVTLEGKNELYVVPYWRKGKEMYTFVDLLNNKLSLFLSNRG